MADHEMLNLDEMGTLKDSMELLGEELMNGHRINPNLYVEYDVKRGLRDSAGWQRHWMDTRWLPS